MNMHAQPPKPAGGALTAAKAWLRALELTTPIKANPERTLPVVIGELADRHGDAPALLSERETLSFRALAARANQYARWALAQNVAKGDVVCLLMPNCPDYMAIWLGISSVGGVVALLNTNLTGAALAHCIDIVAPQHVIVAADLSDAYAGAAAHLAARPQAWHHGDGHSVWPHIDRTITDLSGAPLTAAEKPPITIEDRALCIYTSGTTGLPKAANVNHYRVMIWSYWFAGMMDTGPADRMYNCLPMYHSIGGMVATGAVLVSGGSVLLRERFSTSRFWDDVTDYGCTLFQYIGELCRYLVNAPPHPRERSHKLRLACGNGLRPDIWTPFKNHFAIPHILEFYAATEGNVSLFNVEGKPGAIGRIPAFLAHRFPASIVKFDVETGEPVRGPDGFCIRCAPDEPGEAIGRIKADAENLGGRFEGYTDAAASDKKLLRDVFAPGDLYFRTGDLMRRDAKGFYYFVDRIGDTFRWKGENVSTAEVAETIAAFPGIREANVYGVAIPHSDGRAGMAAVVADDLDLLGLHRHIAGRLPAYARPLFLRLRPDIEITATFKHKKTELAREGFDPVTISDPIYFNDPARGFVPLDAALYSRIVGGEIRL